MDIRDTAIYHEFDTRSQIRVLRVLPPGRGSQSGAPRIVLKIVELDSVANEFQAISYTWGQDTCDREIIVNDTPVLIPWNAFTLLSEYHNTDLAAQGSEWLWIDVICIRQKNDEERNHQVALMGEIYRKAANTIIWLDDLSMRRTISSPLRTMLVQERYFIRLGPITWYPFRVMTEVFGNGTQDFLEEAATAELLAILNHDYWRRLWIIQEVVLARKVRLAISGACIDLDSLMQSMKESDVIDYDHVRQALTKNNTTTGQTSFELVDFLLKCRSSHREGSRQAMVQLLAWAKQHKCQDSRDRIFGLVSLASDGEQFEIDYGKDNVQIFFDILRKALQDGMPFARAAEVVVCYRHVLELNELKADPEQGIARRVLAMDANVRQSYFPKRQRYWIRDGWGIESYLRGSSSWFINLPPSWLETASLYVVPDNGQYDYRVMLVVLMTDRGQVACVSYIGHDIRWVYELDIPVWPTRVKEDATKRFLVTVSVWELILLTSERLMPLSFSGALTAGVREPTGALVAVVENKDTLIQTLTRALEVFNKGSDLSDYDEHNLQSGLPYTAYWQTA